jgi:hypothetical protein
MLSGGFSDEAPINGAYARIVIEPQDDEDGKISLLEKYTYSNQLTVKVKKNQDIDNRYAIYDGKILDIVSSTSDLVFTNHLFISTTDYKWVANDYVACTSLTLLKVSGGSTISFDGSSLDSDYSKLFVRVYQFDALPLDSNLASNFVVSFNYPAASSISLDKSTRYVLLAVDSGSSGLKFTDTAVSALPSCFSISK